MRREQKYDDYSVIPYHCNFYYGILEFVSHCFFLLRTFAALAVWCLVFVLWLVVSSPLASWWWGRGGGLPLPAAAASSAPCLLTCNYFLLFLRMLDVAAPAYPHRALA